MSNYHKSLSVKYICAFLLDRVKKRYLVYKMCYTIAAIDISMQNCGTLYCFQWMEAKTLKKQNTISIIIYSYSSPNLNTLAKILIKCDYQSLVSYSELSLASQCL